MKQFSEARTLIFNSCKKKNINTKFTFRYLATPRAHSSRIPFTMLQELLQHHYLLLDIPTLVGQVSNPRHILQTRAQIPRHLQITHTIAVFTHQTLNLAHFMLNTMKQTRVILVQASETLGPTSANIGLVANERRPISIAEHARDVRVSSRRFAFVFAQDDDRVRRERSAVLAAFSVLVDLTQWLLDGFIDSLLEIGHSE